MSRGPPRPWFFFLLFNFNFGTVIVSITFLFSTCPEAKQYYNSGQESYLHSGPFHRKIKFSEVGTCISIHFPFPFSPERGLLLFRKSKKKEHIILNDKDRSHPGGLLPDLNSNFSPSSQHKKGRKLCGREKKRKKKKRKVSYVKREFSPLFGALNGHTKKPKQ